MSAGLWLLFFASLRGKSDLFRQGGHPPVSSKRCVLYLITLAMRKWANLENGILDGKTFVRTIISHNVNCNSKGDAIEFH